jgi:hypothetical protein
MDAHTRSGLLVKSNEASSQKKPKTLGRIA